MEAETPNRGSERKGMTAHDVGDYSKISIDAVLPSEILLCIFRFLDEPEDVVHASAVNRLWHGLTKDEELWKNLSFRRFKMCRNEANNSWRMYFAEKAAITPHRLNRILVHGVDSSFSILSPDGEVTELEQEEEAKINQQGTWSTFGDRIAIAKMNAKTRECSLNTYDYKGKLVSVTKTPCPAFYVYWSPDGTRMANLSNYQVQGWGFDIALQYIDVAQPDPANLLIDHGRPLYYCWCPTGEPRLLVHIGETRLDVISILDDGKAEIKKIKLAKQTQPGRFTTPFWISENQFMYVTKTGGKGNWTMKMIIATERKTMQPLDDIKRMAVLELRKILQEFDVDYSDCVEKVDLVNKVDYVLNKQVNVQEEVIHNEESDVIHFIPCPNATKIAYTTHDQTLEVVDIAQKRAQGFDYRPLKIKDEVLAFFWSPNSNYLMYLTPGPSENPRLVSWWIHDFTLNESHAVHHFCLSVELANNYLPFFCQYSLNISFFSPDSNFVVFCDDPEEEVGGVWICGVQKGSRPTRIGDGTFAVWSPV